MGNSTSDLQLTEKLSAALENERDFECNKIMTEMLEFFKDKAKRKVWEEELSKDRGLDILVKCL
jgi:hypothetical protein